MAVFTERVHESIRLRDMIRRGELVLVAVSGGPDSLSLLHALQELAPELGFSLHVAHLDHGFRGREGADDATFVRGQAELLGIPATLERTDVPALARREKRSPEDAGRQARYAFLRHVAENVGASKIALGHTLDDQAETLLLRLLRGAGSAGLGAMAPVRADGIIRPLLNISRREVEEFCRQRQLTPRLDPSNRDPAFLRNRVRWEVLPLLDSFNPQVREVLARTAEDLRWDEEFMQEAARRAYAERVHLTPGGADLDLGGLPNAVRRRLLRRVAQELGGQAFHRHVAELEGAQDAAVTLPGDVRALRKGERVRFRRQSETGQAPDWELELPVPGRIQLPSGGTLEARLLEGEEGRRMVGSEVSPGRAFFDYDCLPEPLAVRNRRLGDRFQPWGMEQEVKLKSFFIARKVPRELRTMVPLVTVGTRILWVAGYRTSTFCPIQATTRSVLELQLF